MGLLDKLSNLLGTSGGCGVRATVLVLGLDGAGKTSVLHALKPQPHPQPAHMQPAPTLSATHDHFNNGGVTMSWCDVSGVPRHRALWERHYRAADALVFVVDAADHLRLVVAREELQLALSHPELASRRIPLLVLANKSDGPNALPPAAVATALGLESVRDKPYHVVASSATSGAGLDAGMAWLVAQIRDKHHKQHKK